MDGAIAFAIVLFAYFLPMLIAAWRGHPQQNAIALLNLFLGWTGLGWIAALIWSATAVPMKPESEVKAEVLVRPQHCPWCKRSIPEGRFSCPACGKAPPLEKPTTRSCPALLCRSRCKGDGVPALHAGDPAGCFGVNLHAASTPVLSPARPSSASVPRGTLRVGRDS